jgi:hypothetical protein
MDCCVSALAIPCIAAQVCRSGSVRAEERISSSGYCTAMLSADYGPDDSTDIVQEQSSVCGVTANQCRTTQVGSCRADKASLRSGHLCFRRWEFILRCSNYWFIQGVVAHGQTLNLTPCAKVGGEVLVRPVWWRSYARRHFAEFQQYVEQITESGSAAS